MTRPSRTDGKTSAAKTRMAGPAKGRKTTKKKRSIAPAATRVKRRSVSDPNKDLKEARAQQAATAEILKVIASSPSDVQPVFEAIASSANRLLRGFSTAVSRFIDGMVHLAAFTPVNPTADATLRSTFPAPTTVLPAFVLAARGEPAQIADTEALADEKLLEISRARGFRSVLFVPLMNGGLPIGMISVARVAPGTFAPHHVQLLQTFADQAVIAIENVRLFNKTNEALERQTATADILKVIAASPTDVQPVFDAIAESARRLLASHTAVVTRVIDDVVHLAASTAETEAPAHAAQGLLPYPLSSDRIHARVARTGQLAVNTDAPNSDLPREIKEFARTVGWRSMLVVPMLRNGLAIGTIGITRREAGSFDDKTIDLLRIFADQAVIAIENVRLFNETKEALERQTATADILKVIASSPDDVQPVFEAIAERSNQLIRGLSTAVYSIVDDVMHLMAFTRINPEADAALRASYPRPLSGAHWADQARRGEVVELPDAETELAEQPALLQMSRLRGFRSALFVPLLRDGILIGQISVTRREPGKFAPNHVRLLQTFADQAVIAIENVRLFDEVQARTRELSDSLEQQTATSEVLEVISTSTGELQPVFQKMLENATRTCGARFGVMSLWDGTHFHFAAGYEVPPAFAEARKTSPIPTVGALANVVETRRFVQIDDVRSSSGYLARAPHTVAIAELAGARTLVIVPMVQEDKLVGVITIYRQEVKPFTGKQIALVENFTKQAVIAIENARLLNELRQRTNDLTESLEQQTATSEVLRVISSTPGDLELVFKSMLENATRICGANFGQMNLYEEGSFRPVALYNMPAAYTIRLAHMPFRPHPQSGLGTVARTHQVVHVADSRALPAYLKGDPSVVAISDLAGARSYFVVPMLKENALIGAITIYRQEVKPFTVKQTELVANFANQAVIAIENTRLLNELRERTIELSQSLDDLRTAQDRLVQTEKLASLGQLTAGIAHEIKNPLNFVNNFAALSAELTEELNDVLRPTELAEKVRAEVDELTSMLKDNLQKVVQHGKRADSIVKNMLLHSREGSGEQRSADINALVNESLNLAYHGARAEKGEFNVTLLRDFDTDAGSIELFPQEISRAFLNLIANGVYAATRRKTEDKEPGFEPTLRAATKSLGSTVEIRIRDNGTGIPTEVKEKMFNPFFTTKPAGEGTGLGLSMTHDIIVKQHGGRIDVDTEPGSFTEFIITLPRTSSLRKTPGGTT